MLVGQYGSLLLGILDRGQLSAVGAANRSSMFPYAAFSAGNDRVHYRNDSM